MKKITIFLIVILLFSISFFCGCLESNNGDNEENSYQQKPNIIVTGKTTRTGYEGINYCFYIDVVIRNYGETGNAYVWAEVNQDSNRYEKREYVYLEAGKSQSMTFKFCEFSYWSSDSGSYRIWIE